MIKTFSKLSACYALLIGLVAVLISNVVYAEEYFNIKNGELERPTGFREWIYVGTPVTPNDLNGGKAAFPEHHNVYIDPKSWSHWKKTGKFRDGTILMKELVNVGSKAAVSGNGYFQGEFIGLEATIKSKKHFPNEPGNWAYYSFSNPDLKTLKDSAKAFPARHATDVMQVQQPMTGCLRSITRCYAVARVKAKGLPEACTPISPWITNHGPC